jgi:hypothetical protein
LRGNSSSRGKAVPDAGYAKTSEEWKFYTVGELAGVEGGEEAIVPGFLQADVIPNRAEGAVRNLLLFFSEESTQPAMRR